MKDKNYSFWGVLKPTILLFLLAAITLILVLVMIGILLVGVNILKNIKG